MRSRLDFTSFCLRSLNPFAIQDHRETVTIEAAYYIVFSRSGYIGSGVLHLKWRVAKSVAQLGGSMMLDRRVDSTQGTDRPTLIIGGCSDFSIAPLVVLTPRPSNSADCALGVASRYLAADSLPAAPRMAEDFRFELYRFLMSHRMSLPACAALSY